MNIDLTKDRRAQERPSDDLDGTIPVRLTREELRGLSALSPLRSTFHILAEWTLIFTAICLCQRHFSLVAYLLTVAFIGARQHALLGLSGGNGRMPVAIGDVSAWERFRATFVRRGRARLTLAAHLVHLANRVASFEGDFVALS